MLNVCSIVLYGAPGNMRWELNQVNAFVFSRTEPVKGHCGGRKHGRKNNVNAFAFPRKKIKIKIAKNFAFPPKKKKNATNFSLAQKIF